MRRSYIFIYDDTVGSREKVRSAIERMSHVYTWRYDMPNAFYIISDYSAGELAKQFESINGTEGRFIFLEHSANSQGRLLPDSWFLLNNKYHKPKDQ